MQGALALQRHRGPTAAASPVRPQGAGILDFALSAGVWNSSAGLKDPVGHGQAHAVVAEVLRRSWASAAMASLANEPDDLLVGPPDRLHALPLGCAAFVRFRWAAVGGAGQLSNLLPEQVAGGERAKSGPRGQRSGHAMSATLERAHAGLRVPVKDWR